jgi:hypothetical protein
VLALPVAAPAPPLPVESIRLTATRQGVPVVQLRAEERGSSYVVECVVHPVGSPTLTRHAGPYAFAGREGALAFLQEAERALSYLGCRIDHSLAPSDPVRAEAAPDPAELRPGVERGDA